ncbi:MAG: TIGR00341 family protein [Chlorobiales bacterium]|nr:TIGR00341 family protein [Chlorobiales bacterium]
MRNLFRLDEDTDKEGTLESIKKNIEFKGANIWALIFAIFLASVGLNMNSTAVIIGAMLISPLMGPIIGIGFSMGVNDIETLKRSFRNLSVAIFISILTSALYFLISPINEAQSELLARTTPTTYDVLIAIFGGGAGVVAFSRKGEKGTAIPGVAIATALMPPLCTVGFGLATMNFRFFFGAFYLFMINSVFIALSTTVFIRYLKFEKTHFLDAQRERKVRNYMVFFAILTIIPSVYVAWQVVRETLFEANAKRFINESFQFSGTEAIRTSTLYQADTSKIEITLIGKPLSDDVVESLQDRLPQYKLYKTKLIINQPFNNGVSIDRLSREVRAGVIEDIYKRNEDSLRSKQVQIRSLQKELAKYKETSIPLTQLAQELRVQYPGILSVGYNKTLVASVTDMKTDTIPTFLVNWKSLPNLQQKKTLENFLKVRMNLSKIDVINRMGTR